MKKLILAIITIGCVVVVSCKKEKQKPVVLTGFYMTATMNSTAGTSTWIGDPLTSKIPDDTLQVQATNTSDNSSLKFKMLFRGMVSYYIVSENSSFTTTSGGTTTFYRLDATKTNTFTVNQYDTVSKVIQGTFGFHFVKIAGNSTVNNIDLLNGKFWLQVPF